MPIVSKIIFKIDLEKIKSSTVEKELPNYQIIFKFIEV